MDAVDFDDNGKVDITDAIAGLTHLFGSGPPPAAPGKEECGPDPTEDAVDGGDLGCEAHAACDG